MSEQTNSLQSIFLEALEIEDHQERAAFLARTCGSDSALRQEVEALIHAHTAAPQFLPEKPEVTGVRKAVLSAAEAALSPDGTPDLRTADRTGDRIGHYKLLEQIGEGGCGVVFMAEQTVPVQRRVALKVIKLGMDTRQVVARFEAERQALALMDHPNIARVFDAGATGTGQAIGAPLQHGGRVTWVAFSPDGQSVVTASRDKTARVWNSATGAPLTPPLPHNLAVVGAHWSGDGKRLHTVTEDSHLQVWDLTSGEQLTPPRRIQEDRSLASNPLASAQSNDKLPSDDRPIADLVLLSQILAVRRIDVGDNVVPLQLPELLRATRSLRERYPWQFAATPLEVAAWHRREAADSELETNLTATLFHIDRALKWGSHDQDLVEERAAVAAALTNGSHAASKLVERSRRIPPRDPAASAQQIDLSTHYNLGLQESIGGPDDNNLADLRVGLHTFGGVRFDVRGIIRLAQKDGPTDHPGSIKDIRVGRKCRLLHFVQAASELFLETETQVGTYVLHYADGQCQELHILYGRDLATWWFLGLPEELKGPGHAVVAWGGDNPIARKRDSSICLWKSSRENPRPDAEVVSIDFLSARKSSAPFLVALTVE